jgi:hypothetical protein
LRCGEDRRKRAYRARAEDGLPHQSVNHRQGHYVIGAFHTNTIEGFWSIFKRGIVGSFHKVSKKYLPLYVAEFQFRYIIGSIPTLSERRLLDAEVGLVIAYQARELFAQ